MTAPSVPAPIPSTGIVSRYAFALFANILRVGFVSAFTVVLARALGPGQFGDLNFLLTTCAAFVTLFDFGVGQAFFTLISQRPRGKNFFVLYALFLAGQALILLVGALLLPDFLRHHIWPEQSRWLVVFAMGTALVTGPLWNFSAQLGESVRDTRGVQTRNLLYSAAVFLTLVLLTQLTSVTVAEVLWIQSLWYLLLGGAYIRKIFSRPDVICQSDTTTLRENAALLYRNARPLIGYTAAGFLYVYLDSWLLRYFGGAVEQGYYAIGMRFCIIGSLATMAFLNIYWKEMAEAWDRKNHERLERIFTLSYRSFYLGTTCFSAFAICWLPEIVTHFLGSDYQNARIPLTILFLYPLHNSLNQIVELALLATGNGRSKAIVGYLFFSLSIAMGFLLLAPQSGAIPGFELGATGIALKSVACQFVQANLGILFLRRIVGLKVTLLFQVGVLMLFFSLAAGLRALVASLLPGMPVAELCVMATMYGAACAAILYRFPQLAGVSRERVRSMTETMRRRVWAA